MVATGPLTSESLAQSIMLFAGSQNLYFYDAISPIVDSNTLDRSRLSAASRYGKGGEDYLNAFLSKEEYLRFYEALIGAEAVPLRAFERAQYFEGCLPIGELARRGVETLRFGPMKPVGLTDPRTGKRPYAAVQLRLENLMADSYNLVGFQNHLKFPEQNRVFRLIPGLGKADFTALRTDSSEFLYPFAEASLPDAPGKKEAGDVFCRTDLRCRRVCRIDRDRTSCRY